MKFLKLVFLFCLTITISQAQTTTLNVSESSEFKDESRSENVLAINTTNDGVTGILRGDKHDFLIDVFDNNLNKTYTETIESSKKETFKGYVNLKNAIKFITVYAPKKRERIVYCHTFNLITKTYSKAELFSADVEKGGLFTGRNKRQTSIAISPNENYIAIATDNEKKNLNSYMIHVYDAESLKLVYKKAYQEDEEQYYEPNDLIVDDSGEVYSVGKLFLSGKTSKKKGEANYKFILNKINETENDAIDVELNEEEFISSLVLHRFNDTVKLLGFYSEKRDGRIKGGCSFKIDTNNFELLDKTKETLPESVYNDLYGYRKAVNKNKKKKELKSFYVDYVIEDNSGNTYLLAEEFYVTQTYVAGPNGAGYWQTVYHYDDILILKFNADGSLGWGRSVFKKATSPSYNAFLKDDKLHVILNSGKNLTEKKDGRTKVSKGWFESSALYDFEYTSSGDVSFNKIQDNKGNTHYFPFYGTYRNDRFIMMSGAKRKRQFMILQ